VLFITLLALFVLCAKALLLH